MTNWDLIGHNLHRLILSQTIVEVQINLLLICCSQLEVTDGHTVKLFQKLMIIAQKILETSKSCQQSNGKITLLVSLSTNQIEKTMFLHLVLDKNYMSLHQASLKHNSSRLSLKVSTLSMENILTLNCSYI